MTVYHGLQYWLSNLQGKIEDFRNNISVSLSRNLRLIL